MWGASLHVGSEVACRPAHPRHTPALSPFPSSQTATHSSTITHSHTVFHPPRPPPQPKQPPILSSPTPTPHLHYSIPKHQHQSYTHIYNVLARNHTHPQAARRRLDRERVPGDSSGFRMSRRPLGAGGGSHLVLLALQQPGSRNTFSIARPNTGGRKVGERGERGRGGEVGVVDTGQK